ncbi:MAG: hypothetical protein ACM3U2_10530 [Deltaproteobacteria bacterium]
MRTMILSIAAAAALLPFCVGCTSQQTQVARGQAPSGTFVTAYGDEVCDDPCDESCKKGRCRLCRGRGCPHCRPYRIPRNLSYPPDGFGSPGGSYPPAGPQAIVQYPYYTCKGPDDFFFSPCGAEGPVQDRRGLPACYQ